MFRTGRIAASAVALVLGILLATINVHPVSTVLSVALAVLALYVLIISSDGLHTAYMEELHSDLSGRLSALEALFTEAEQSIQILVGELGTRTYFNKKVFSACRDAIKKHGVGVQIILAEPDANLEDVKANVDQKLWQEFVGWVNEGKVSIQRTKHRVTPHFMVVDNTHAWIEDPHAKRSRQGENKTPRSRTVYFCEDVARYTNRFADLARQLPPLSVA